MGSSHTPDAVPDLRTLSQVQTTQSLVLSDKFPTRSLLLQYLSGMLCADGTVRIAQKAPQKVQAVVRFYQSNTVFLTAINKEFDNTGYVRVHSGAGTQANINEGRYSKGELRQKLTFYDQAACKVAAELLPFTVTKTQHFKLLLEMQKQPNGLLTNRQWLDRISTLNNNSQDCILEVKNITPHWMAGMFDGDGCINVHHTQRTGRSGLVLTITWQATTFAMFTRL